MNKTKTVLAATGGVLALGVLVMAALTYLAYSDRTAAFEGDDETEGLESAVSKVASLMGKKPFPSLANKKRIEENGRLLEECRARLFQEASKGDWCPDGSCGTPAQFKEMIARDVKALATLKGAGSVPLVKPEFGFGPFKEYLADKMPSVEQLPRLQRQWFDITSLIDVLSTNGVIQITDLQAVEPKAEEPKPGAAKRKFQKKNAAKAAAEARKPSVETYKVAFQASPAAFVGVVRQLSFQERFTVVDSFGFVRARDTIAEALGGGEKKEAPAAAGGRRRRRGASPAEQQPAEEEKDKKQNAVVFDPETDATLNAELVVSVYDFRSLEEDEKGDAK